MGTQEVGVNDNTPRGVTAADATIEETISRLVASQTGIVTITAGDILSWDTTSYGGSVRSNVVAASHTTNFPNPVGVALDSITIPATTAAGDRFTTLRLLRRGFHPSVNILTAATVGHSVAIGAVAGQGISVASASVTAAQSGHGTVGIVMGVGSANRAPVYVNMAK